jgi:glycosyltransferase involved in cell wall biosynthesis
MHIALYYHGRIPARGYGGTQRVVEGLARGLSQLGHRVTLLAAEGSQVRGSEAVTFAAHAPHQPGFDLTRYLPTSVDILHAHAPVAAPLQCPHVFTLHGNLKAGTAPPPNTIFLSADHARRYGGTAFVYNGVDSDELEFRETKSGYDLFLGRLHRVKGYRWAIEGARRSGHRLIVAGGWRPTLRRGLTFVGSVDGSRKAGLLARAACLWMPALWEEPFGLTLVEAMLSGTPVLGTRRGSLPEIISSEVGALGDTLDELVELRAAAGRCDPHACRERAERWFLHTTMAAEYARMYRDYLALGRLPPGRLAL